ncbi:MAG: adhesin/invasin, partial [bacterium]
SLFFAKEAGSDDGNVPEWLKRTSYSIELENDQKLKYYFETVQPLWETNNGCKVLFNHSRISLKDSRPTYNIGLGLRELLNDDLLLGGNIFYDYQDLHKHSRLGVGGEYITQELEARINGYLRIVNERIVSENDSEKTIEKVANGFDAELGGPVPFFKMLSVYGGGYWYHFDHFQNKYGWKLRSELKPYDFTRLTFELYNDTKRGGMSYSLEGALSLRFTSFALGDILGDIREGRRAYAKADLREKMLDRVVRDFDITVVRVKEDKTTGLTVEAGRK